MRKITSAITLATVLTVAASGAFAATASMKATGTVKSVTSKTLTLADGSHYSLPKKFDIKMIKKGEKVEVAYLKNGKMMEATTVKAVTAKAATKAAPTAASTTKPATSN